MRDDGKCKERARERWPSGAASPSEQSCDLGAMRFGTPFSLHGCCTVCALRVCVRRVFERHQRAFLTGRRRQGAAAVQSLEGGGWMEMTSLEPAVTPVPLGHPRMPCGSRVDEVGSKNADQAHTRTHTPAVFSSTDTLFLPLWWDW